ncbi:MAG: nucleotidyltransferase domain-containing protein [Bacteroidales bacterium]
MSESRKYGLLEKDLEKIVSIFKSNPGVEELLLFGSRAKGNNVSGSDIDLAIKGKGLNLDDILKAKSEIDKLSLPYKTDIIIYERIKDIDLVDHIDRAGISLFKRQP